jgi:hypothetical protein
MNTFADKILQFYCNLDPGFRLPQGVEVMNPFRNDDALQLSATFYHRFYDDTQPRNFIFGINPGRLGGGVTGIPFTDPVRLKEICGINHHLPLKQELSSDFIYQFIDKAGGPEAFYSRFFLTAVCPLGFTLHGKNLNYYDSKELYLNAKPFIVHTLKQQAETGCIRETAWCLGEGTNLKYFEMLNKELQLFRRIIPLPHPRWIMQYRRKKLDDYIKLYLDKLH